MNEYKRRGVTYIARPISASVKIIGCAGCAHEGLDADGRNSEGCRAAPNCLGDVRTDGRSIIWVVKK